MEENRSRETGRPGRRFGSGKPARTNIVRVLLTDEEYRHLMDRVQATNQSASEIIRAALADVPKDPEHVIIKDLLANGFTRDEIAAIRAALTASDRATKE